MISIIIPFKNTPIMYFTKLIDSLNNQTSKEFEAIFIDDNSNNGQIYKDIIAKNNYIYKKVNYFDPGIPTLGRARDFGVSISNGNYIWFVDSDDYIDISSIEILNKKFNIHKNIDAIFFNYIEMNNKNFNNIDNRKNKNFNIKKEYIFDIKKKNFNVLKKFFLNNFQSDWRVCFNKNFILNNNIKHSKEVSIFEDVYFNIIWKNKINRILLIDDYLYFYNRLNNNSILNSNKKNELINKKNYAVFKAFDDLKELSSYELNNFISIYYLHILYTLKKTKYNDRLKISRKYFCILKKFKKISFMGFNKKWFSLVFLHKFWIITGISIF